VSAQAALQSALREQGGNVIPMRSLGQGLKVSAIGYGAMGLSFGYGPPTDKQQARSSEPRSSAA
jgi:hypothetical protein